MKPGRRSEGSIQRWLTWAGLGLMIICFAWLQLTPSTRRDHTAETRSSENETAIRLVVIDAGHGGQDSGAMRNGVLEKDLTLDVARRVQRLVQAQGLQTVLTRANDSWVSLGERAERANREHGCVFVSIHFDEGARAAATGVQTFYAIRQAPETSVPSWLSFLQPAASDSANVASQSLAGFVQEALVTRTQAFNRGTKAEQFFVVANVRHPAVLVEGGFLSNDEDLAKIQTENYREQLAAAITDGILRYRKIVAHQPTTLASATTE